MTVIMKEDKGYFVSIRMDSIALVLARQQRCDWPTVLGGKIVTRKSCKHYRRDFRCIVY